tara:strand:+ start:147 stop:254 length:108 start_codon:yes stop_codon:yes gene_type:complete
MILYRLFGVFLNKEFDEYFIKVIVKLTKEKTNENG